VSTEAIFLDSGSHEALACLGRPLHVSMRTPTLTAYPVIMNRLSASRWEFVTTLDYEWSVIRRRRPYRWTIGVRNLRVSLPDPEMIDLSLFNSADLFHYAPGHAHGRNT
jgi:hypothetical protein